MALALAAAFLVGVGAALAVVAERRAWDFVEPTDIGSWLDFMVVWGSIPAAAVICAILGLAAALLYRGQLKRAQHHLDAVGIEMLWLRGALNDVPGGLIAWRALNGAEVTSRGVAAFCRAEGSTEDTGKIYGFADLCAALPPNDAARLEAAVGDLRSAGAPFSCTVPRAADRPRIAVQGRRVTGADGEAVADVIWLIDDSTTDTNAWLEARTNVLKQERDAYRVMLDTVPIPIWRRDARLGITHCNVAYLAALGSVGTNEAEPGADTGPDIKTSDPTGGIPELVGGPLSGMGRAMAERARMRRVPQSERHHTVIAGSRRLLEFWEHTLTSGDGSAGYAIDQTATEQAESELTRHVEAHAEVLERLATAIEIYGPDQRLTFFNEAYQRMTGLKEDWLKGRPTLTEVLDQLRDRSRLPEYADFPAFKTERLRLFTSLLRPQEDLMHLPDDTTIRMVVGPHPLGGLVFAYEDVTDRLALERNYNTLIAVQRATLDNLHEAIAVFGGDGRLKLCNPVYARLWHLAPASLPSEPHVTEVAQAGREFFGDDAASEAGTAWMVSRVTEPETDNGRLERADGSVLDYACVPLPDGGVMFSFMDVTDTIRAERTLRDRATALEEADRVKSEFIRHVSYELRTPLGAITGFADVLVNCYFGPLNDRQMEYAQGILDSGNRLFGLVDDIIDLATVEAGYESLERKPLDVHGLLVGVLALVRERLRRAGVSVRFECPTGVGEVMGDESRLKQAFYNLLSNAISITPVGGTIGLFAYRDPDKDPPLVTVAVADNLDATPIAEQQGLFGNDIKAPEPDSTLPDGATDQPDRDGAGGERDADIPTGEGLGLSLVRSYVSLHGGNVDVLGSAGAPGWVCCHFPSIPSAQLPLALPTPAEPEETNLLALAASAKARVDAPLSGD